MKDALSREQVQKLGPKDVHKILEKSMLADGYPIVCDLQKSNGVNLYDSKSEEFYLDFFSFFASLPIGFNHPKLTSPEFIAKLGEVAINKPSLADFYTVEMAQFVETFRRVAMPEEMKYVFFISGGALAVENAIKVAFDWKVRKNIKAGKGELGSKIIHFVRAFHGRSGYTLSLTNSPDPRKTDYFPKFDWPRIINPKVTFPIKDHLEEIEALEKMAIQEIMDAIANNPDDIAGILIEPIQGEGGDNHFRPEFMIKLREICDENEILLIFDEVQSGFGMTGKFWAYEHLGMVPDLVSFGKKSQVCGILSTGRIDEVPENCFHTSSRINSTWGGNLVDMVRSQRVLEIIEEDNLVENSKVVGDYLVGRLAELHKKYPALVSNVRGKGLMAAFDIVTTEKRDKLCSTAYENKVIVLPCGDRSVRFRPTLITTNNDIDKGIDVIDAILKTI